MIISFHVRILFPYNENKDSSFFSKNNDLRNRILFTFLLLCVYRLGTYVPLPGIDPESLKTMMQSNEKGLLGMFNIFSGGAVKRMAIFVTKESAPLYDLLIKHQSGELPCEIPCVVSNHKFLENVVNIYQKRF